MILHHRYVLVRSCVKDHLWPALVEDNLQTFIITNISNEPALVPGFVGVIYGSDPLAADSNHPVDTKQDYSSYKRYQQSWDRNGVVDGPDPQ